MGHRRYQIAFTLSAIVLLACGSIVMSLAQGEKPPINPNERRDMPLLQIHSGPIRGKIVLPSGKPPEKARVSLVRQMGTKCEVQFETFTEGSGAFAFENPKWPAFGEPELKLVVEAEGCGLTYRGLADWKNGEVVKAEPATELHISFYQPMGKPASGVHIWPEFLVLRREDRPRFLMLPNSIAERYKARLGSGGDAVIKGLPQGHQVRLAHDSPNYSRLTFEQQITLANAATTDVTAQHFSPGCSLAGKVTLATTGAGVAGVKVLAQEAFDREASGGGNGWGDAFTDKNGNFVVGQLSPGKYNLNVMLEGQLEREWTSVAYESTPAKAGENRTEMDIKLIKGGLIVGTVKFSDGKPIFGIHVGVYGPARPQSGAWVQSSLSDRDGRYALRVPAGANHVYLMSGPDFTDAPRDTMQDVTVQEGKEIKVDFTIPK